MLRDDAGWGEPILPMITGHEIAGKVSKVGSKVTEFKVGDRAGVGAQGQSPHPPPLHPATRARCSLVVEVKLIGWADVDSVLVLQVQALHHGQ